MRTAARLLATLAAALVLLGGLFVCAVWLVSAFDPSASRDFGDFRIYYAAAAALRAAPGRSLYDPATLQLAHTAGKCAVSAHDYYVYPPLFALALEPLTLLPCAAAFHVWTVANTLLLAAIIAAVTWRTAPLVPAPWRLAFALGSAGCWLLAFPVLIAMGMGQVTFLVLAGLLALFASVRRRRWATAGALVAILAALKLFPAFLLLAALARRRWPAVGGFAAAGLLLLAVMFVGTGPSQVLAARGLLAGAGENTTRGPNHALATTVPGGAPLSVAVLVVFLAGVWLVWRRDGGGREGCVQARQGASATWMAAGTDADMLAHAWALLTLLLALPLVWDHYFVWVVPAVLATCLVVADARARWGVVALLLGCMAPLAVIPAPLRSLVLLALWAFVGWLTWRRLYPATPAPRAQVHPADAPPQPAQD